MGKLITDTAAEIAAAWLQPQRWHLPEVDAAVDNLVLVIELRQRPER